jgi:hypothetical protein
MPIMNIPIVVSESDLNEQYLENIAFSLKNQHTARYLENIIVPSVEEPEIIAVVDSLSSETSTPVVEEDIQPETQIEII